MERDELKAEYLKLENESDREIKELERQFSRISTLRIISFLVGAALLIIGITDRMVVAGVSGVACLAAFVFFVKEHSQIVLKADIVKSKRLVISRYVMRLGEEWRSLEAKGTAYIRKEDTVATDIDLLGPDSLFQMINVCHTELGEQRLANTMKLEKFDSSEIELRNEAIKELIEKREFAVDFEASGIRLESGKKRFNPSLFEEYCKDTSKGEMPAWAEVIRIVMPALELIVLGLCLSGLLGFGVFIGLFFVVLFFTWLTKSVSDSVILPLYNMNSVVDDYLCMMREIENQEFCSAKLIAIKERLCGDKGALRAFEKLKSISQAYNVSFNPLIHQILSGIMLWDYQLAHIVGRWKKQYGENADGCFEMLGELEELLSFAVIGVVRKTCWAKVDEADGCNIDAKQLYHPLISPDKVVANDAKLKHGITIITGSNMSGKTTFLRTLAINLALAYMGAPVCGESLKTGYMRMFTSMRIVDDVAGGISTFYAEILRIKQMAVYRKENIPMLCLIDEIFKGTNSSDRIVGAREVITKLAGDNCMTIVSTHDFELCELKDSAGNEAVNYHFQEYYEDDALKFDYTIKDGRCTTTNARAILRIAGFEVEDNK